MLTKRKKCVKHNYDKIVGDKMNMTFVSIIEEYSVPEPYRGYETQIIIGLNVSCGFHGRLCRWL